MKDYTTTEDGHYIIINGRKWRASDPSIPKALRSQLVAVLMKARSDVAKALRSNDKILEKNARSRVNDAKISLGERGAVWWEPYDDTALRSRLKSSMLTLLRHREPGKSICPSEAARVIGSPDHWRTIMPIAREVAVELANKGILTITRGNQLLDPEDLGKGHIRIRHGESFDNQ
ncbi:MAG: DUF3253 domain-containing protein [Tunicatimonas sp.]|uniref:DUF3253 domain-containing protein n=1 Tax=Tunicatimonas sp. TaxID=1940096 RepID=UPI003C733826